MESCGMQSKIRTFITESRNSDLERLMKSVKHLMSKLITINPFPSVVYLYNFVLYVKNYIVRYIRLNKLTKLIHLNKSQGYIFLHSKFQFTVWIVIMNSKLCNLYTGGLKSLVKYFKVLFLGLKEAGKSYLFCPDPFVFLQPPCSVLNVVFSIKIQLY